MTTFHPIVLKCPQCGGLMNDYELMSYTIHHATVYSDGNSNQHHRGKEISICAVCHLPFWRKDATLPEDPDWDTEGLGGPIDIYDLPWHFDENVQELTIEYYKDLLDDDFAYDDEKEIYMIASKLLVKNWIPGEPVRLLGVGGSHFTEPHGQLSFNLGPQ